MVGSEDGVTRFKHNVLQSVAIGAVMGCCDHWWKYVICGVAILVFGLSNYVEGRDFA